MTINIKKLIAFLGVGLTLLFVSPTALAAPYGSNSYGDCKYGESCAAYSPSSSSVPTAVPTTDAAAPGTTLLNDIPGYFTSGGTQLTLTTGQVIYFDITLNGVTQRYSVTIDAVGPDYVDITIGPAGIKARLLMNEPKQFDVTGDNTSDIEMTLNSIADGKANITFKNLTAKAAAAPVKSSPAQPRRSYVWPIVSLGVFLTGLILFMIMRIRGRSNNVNF
jgi:hypothetical protein